MSNMSGMLAFKQDAAGAFPARTGASAEEAPERRGLLRFLACGSVDDGKSTLIGRLLYDSSAIPEDELQNVEKDSKRFGTTGGIDLALLVDGLQSEREQGITIDVAYRYFSTAKRSFIVADTPGHEQYTRNMATGASTSDLAVILVDARKGILTQTRRHSYIVCELGIRHVVLAINKMDLVDFSEETFNKIVDDYKGFAEKLGLKDVAFIPIVARDGDNINAPSPRMPWYRGQPLVSFLEEVDAEDQLREAPMRFPVQWVNRPNLDFRGFAGAVASGALRRGDEVVALPSGRTSKIARLVTYDGDIEEAKAGAAVTAVLADEIDLSRGDVLAPAASRPECADQFTARLIWMGDEKMLPHRSYLIRCGAQWATAEITALKYKINVNTLEPVSGAKLELNEFAVCNLSVNRPLIFDSYTANRRTGSFILVDRITNQTVAAGLIKHSLRRATNIHWQSLDVSKTERASLKGQKPCCLWFTGLSGSGKSTVANLLEKRLFAMGRHTYVIDGDNLRHGLNRDLGFTDADRVENIRRAAHVARLMSDAGLIVLTSFISPFEADRRLARELFGEGEFLEVFVDTPLEVCEKRDPKGLYKKAREGLISNFTGISSPYEAPKAPEIVVAGGGSVELEELVEQIVAELQKRGVV